MKAGLLRAPNDLVFKHVPDQKGEPGDLILKVRANNLSASSLRKRPMVMSASTFSMTTCFIASNATSVPTLGLPVASMSTSMWPAYLFYNASNGVLYYEADGSGSKNPYAIATLDKGLNLTASNFSVV